MYEALVVLAKEYRAKLESVDHSSSSYKVGFDNGYCLGISHGIEECVKRLRASEQDESPSHCAEQLKAEIRLLLTEIAYDERGVGQITKGAIARKLRELSAV